MMLLSNGPETNNFFTQEDLGSALADAAKKGGIELVHWLLNKGANVRAEEDVVSISTENMNLLPPFTLLATSAFSFFSAKVRWKWTTEKRRLSGQRQSVAGICVIC
jgi:hypothetical protein